MACPEPEQLDRLVAGDLNPQARGAILDHAASCDECRAGLAVLWSSTGPVNPTGFTESGSGRGAAAAAAQVMRESGEQVGRYLLGPVLGRGAMGVVYEARDPELDRDVAVKVLRPQASAARLRREAQALARLRHPNVVRVYDVGEHDGQAFVAMELVRGHNLREWLVTPRTTDEILRVLLRAGEGLAAAHRAGMIHRDFKPDNVLLSDDGDVLVGDFGLARAAEPGAGSQDGVEGAEPATVMPLSSETLTAQGAVVGTPAYMAPEQALGEATTASDQYAFSITAWEALYGQRPFQGGSLLELRQRASGGAITPPPVGREVPPRVERALRRGLSARPEARFPSVTSMLAALAPPTPRRWLWPLLAAGVAVVALVVVVAASRGGGPRAIHCAEAGRAIDDTWTSATRTAIEQRLGLRVTQAIGRHVERWRGQRIEVCRATHERREQTVASFEREVACLDRARVALGRLLTDVTATSAADFDGQAVLESLPVLERCSGGAAAVASPPPARTNEIAALDLELARAETMVLLRVTKLTPGEATGLRQRAEALGYTPQILRARLLEGALLDALGDPPAAMSAYRTVIVLAEHDADDFTRARAGALLATVLVQQRDPNAASTLAAARAALTRAGDDPQTESILLSAEARLYHFQDDERASAQVFERLIELTIRRFGPDAPALAGFYAQAGGAWLLVGEQDRAAQLYARATAMATQAGRQAGMEANAAALLTADPMTYFGRGDFAGVVALTEQQFTAWQQQPVKSPRAIASLFQSQGLAHELDRDYVAAVESYRAAEHWWLRPAAEFAATGEAPDPTSITDGIAEAVLGQGWSLFGLGQPDAAVVELRRLVTLCRDGGAVTAPTLPLAERLLGVALGASGAHEEAITLLNPAVATFTAEEPKPYSRAASRFYLARSLWEVGGQRDRERAHALLADADRDVLAAIADGERFVYLRKLPFLARDLQAQITAWRQGHPLP